MKTIVTKGEYARLKGRAPSCISNWIAEGKITPAALVGEGIRARVWVERADADLNRNLDLGQQLAQAQPALSAAPPHPEPIAQASPTFDDDLIRRKREADARTAEANAAAAERRNAAEEGRWVEAHKVQQAWGKELAQILAETEVFLFQRLAREIADRHGLDWKSLAVEIRDAWRMHRRESAQKAVDERAGLLAEKAGQDEAAA